MQRLGVTAGDPAGKAEGFTVYDTVLGRWRVHVRAGHRWWSRLDRSALTAEAQLHAGLGYARAGLALPADWVAVADPRRKGSYYDA